MVKISIIGSGYTGSLLGKTLLSENNEVIFYDVDEEVVKKLQGEKYNATSDIGNTIKNSDVSFVCVPTPTVDGKIDLTYLKNAVENIGNQLKRKNSYHTIVIKSTVVPTTTETLVKNSLEKTSGKKCGKDFGLCANPEFMTQVNKTTKDSELKEWYEKNPQAIKDVFSEDKIVIGEFDKKSGDILEQIFSPFKLPIFRTDLKTAEMIKYAHNLVLASRISYWNEIFLICKAFGIDSNKVAEIASLDSRIGKYGIVHGKAFGGTCLPKDLEAFTNFVKDHKINPKLLEAILEINKLMAEKYGTRE